MRFATFSPSPARRSLRLGCALLVGIALAGHLGTVVHQTLVRHAVCAEHGEAKHGADAAALAAEAATHAAFEGLPAAAIDDHEHCLLAFTRRDAVATAGSHAPTVAPPHCTKALGVSAAAAAHVSIATLRLAPKSSPPSFA